MPFKDHPLLPTISLTTATLIWGSSFIVMKYTFAVIDPMVVIFGRMAVASICFLALIPRLGGFTYQRGDIWLLVGMALFEPCFYFIFEVQALVHTTASQAGMVTATLPLMVAVTARLFLGERISRRTFVGFVMAVGGVIWLSLAADSTESAPNPALGNLLEALAMVCAAGYITLLKHLTQRYGPLVLTAIQAFVGCIFFFPFLWLPSTEIPTQWPLPAVGAIVYLGAAVTLCAYGLYNYGVSRVPASQASVFINLIPVFAVVMGVIFLSERFEFWQYPAGLLVFAGVYVSQDRRKKTMKSP